jgi:hypothetical protein
VTSLLALVIVLGGADPARLLGWAADPVTRGRTALARGLAEANLPALSTGVLTEILILERTQPGSVAPALDLYPLSLRGQPAPARVLGALASHPPTGLDEAHASLRAFLVGQALLAGGQPHGALKQLARVAPGSPARAPARYLMGVARVTPPIQDLKAAGLHFRQAIVEAESSPQGARAVVREARRLALLGLARLYFEVGNHEVALYYYRQLPVGAPESAEAEFESAWAHLMRGDMPRALGAVHGARAPGVRHPARAELHLVAGAALMGLCQFGAGRAELDALDAGYLVYLEAASKVAEALRPGEAPLLLEPGGPLPEPVRRLLREQPEVASALAATTRLRAELGHAKAFAAPTQAPMKGLVRRAGGMMKAERARLARATEDALNRLIADWGRLSDARAELMIDLLEEEGERLEAEIASRALGDRVPKSAAVTALGEDWQRWEFDGQWWPDELGYYRSTLPSLCGAGGKKEAP